MSRRHSVPNRSSTKQTRQEIFVILALVPLAVGVLLILSAFTGLYVWGTLVQQILTGGLYILLSFAASNALQKQWTLAGGWVLMGTAVWLWLNVADANIAIVSGALVSIGIAVVVREFLLRRQQYLNSQTR